MIFRQSVTDLFPDGHVLSQGAGRCFQLLPIASRHEGSTCYIEFYLGRMTNSDVELTGWYRQVMSAERVMPVFLDGEWCADFNS